MTESHAAARHYARIESVIRYLNDHFCEQPRLDDLAARVHLSAYHFQRLFQRWAGVSPKRFLQYLTAEYAKARLREARSVLAVTHAAGLSSGARLHDLFVTLHAATPGEWKAGGAGLAIRFGFHPTPFGECLIAATPRGVCALSFVARSRAAALAELALQWPRAELLEMPDATQPIARRLFRPGAGPAAPLALHVRGTNFQIKVWEALLRVPAGAVVSYRDLAALVGVRRGARAVGSAVGQNPVALLIPCHRVIRQTGAFGEYRWGALRKQAILAWEAARRSTT